MPEPIVSEAKYQGEGVPLMLRIKKVSNGAAAVQADFSAITLKVYLKGDSSAVVAEATLSIASVIFETLQLDDLWDNRDNVGYNFKYLTLATMLPHGGQTYIFEFKFTYADPNSTPKFQQFEIPTVDVYQS